MLINAKITQIEANLFTFRSIVYSMKEKLQVNTQRYVSVWRKTDITQQIAFVVDNISYVI